MTFCACGRPLHYTSPRIELAVRRLVASHGEHVTVMMGGQGYLVQRHYIALHGIKAQELPRLVRQGIVRIGDRDP